MSDNGVLVVDDWETPASSYQEEQVGSHCIGKHTYEVGRYRYYGTDGYKYFDVSNPLILTTLKELRDGRWEEWMTDSPTDYRAMQIYAQHASGHVLTSGLGLGLIVPELCKSRVVDSITIVESSPSVMALVGKYLPRDNRIKLLWGDFWKFIFLDDSRWDTIIVDLWVARGTKRHLEIYHKEVLPASEQLKAKYPGAQIVFHGFAGMPTESQITEAIFAGSIDEVLWGLKGYDNLCVPVPSLSA